MMERNYEDDNSCSTEAMTVAVSNVDPQQEQHQVKPSRASRSSEERVSSPAGIWNTPEPLRNNSLLGSETATVLSFVFGSLSHSPWRQQHHGDCIARRCSCAVAVSTHRYDAPLSQTCSAAASETPPSSETVGSGVFPFLFFYLCTAAVPHIRCSLHSTAAIQIAAIQIAAFLRALSPAARTHSLFALKQFSANPAGAGTYRTFENNIRSYRLAADATANGTDATTDESLLDANHTRESISHLAVSALQALRLLKGQKEWKKLAKDLFEKTVTRFDAAMQREVRRDLDNGGIVVDTTEEGSPDKTISTMTDQEAEHKSAGCSIM